jgi:DNA-binding response OmpR family regulator
MSESVQVYAEADAIVVCIPLKVRKRSSRGRRLMLVADDQLAKPIARRETATILKALGRAYRWKRMLESGEFASITDLATAEKINHAYVRRILRLTLLSPKITEAILNTVSSKSWQLKDLQESFSDVWGEQTGLIR